MAGPKAIAFVAYEPSARREAKGRVRRRLNPAGDRVASGGGDNLIQGVRTSRRGVVLNTLKGHAGSVLSPSLWSPDGRQIASGSYDHYAEALGRAKRRPRLER